MTDTDAAISLAWPVRWAAANAAGEDALTALRAQWELAIAAETNPEVPAPPPPPPPPPGPPQAVDTPPT